MAKYSKVESDKDITRINELIRDQVKKAKTYMRLSKLRRESQYLYTLVKSPAWKKHLKGDIRKTIAATKSQYTKTARAINARMNKLGIDKKFDTVIGK